jgi:flavin-dependent dehydrogenase
VAGGVVATLLGQRGWRVLVVERQSWPRDKACGGCLNAAGVRMLRSVGLAELLSGATPLTRFEMHHGRRHVSVAVPAGVAIARREFDARLVESALRSGVGGAEGGGVRFVTNCNARIMEEDAEFRTVRLKRDGEELDVRGRVVFACDGVQGSSLQEQPWAAWQAAEASWIGVAATMHSAEGGALERMVAPGAIGMFLAARGEGYVGVVRQGAGRVHVGAAVSPLACNRAQGAARVLGEILARYDVGLAGLEGITFEGTRPLTGRRRGIAGRRVLVVGDSCGYVEPFTGEGMSWAIRGAISAVSLLPLHLEAWEDRWEREWEALHAREVERRQRWCWRVRGVVRRPKLSGACMSAARAMPGLARWVARRIGA